LMLEELAEILVVARSLGIDGTNNYFNYPLIDRSWWRVITVLTLSIARRRRVSSIPYSTGIYRKELV